MLYSGIGHDDINVTRSKWFQGDTLFPVHLFKDVVIDGNPMTSWKFSPATHIFPDALIAGVAYLVTRNAAAANFITGIVFVSLAVAGSVNLVRSTGIRSQELAICLALLSGATLTLLFSCNPGPHLPNLHYIFLPAFHAGTYVATLWMTVGVLALLRDDISLWHRRIILLALAVLGFLTGVGDPLVMPMFIGPLTVSLLIGCVLGISWNRIRAPLAVAWIACSLGPIVARFCFDVVSIKAFAKPSLGRALSALRTFVPLFFQMLAEGDFSFWLGSFWIVTCFGIIVSICVRRFGKMESLSNNELQRAVALAFLGLSAVAMIAAPIVGGSSALIESDNHGYVLHYFIPFYFNPIFCLPLVIAPLVPWQQIVAMRGTRVVCGLSGAVVTLVMAGVLWQAGWGGHPLHVYVTPLATEIDEAIKEHGLKCGVSGFWKAREINLFVSKPVKAVAITQNIEYFEWMNSSFWFRGKGANAQPFECDFIVTDPCDGLTREGIIAKFGEPAYERELLNNRMLSYSHAPQEQQVLHLLVYNRPKDIAFRQLLLGFGAIGHHQQIPASKLPSQVGVLADIERVATQDRDAAGVLTFGPYIRLPSGHYAVKFEYAADAENSEPVGDWDVVIHPKNQKVRTLAHGKIMPGEKNHDVEVQVEPNVDGSLIETRVHYAGKGRLAVRGVEVKRLR